MEPGRSSVGCIDEMGTVGHCGQQCDKSAMNYCCYEIYSSYGKRESKTKDDISFITFQTTQVYSVAFLKNI